MNLNNLKNEIIEQVFKEAKTPSGMKMVFGKWRKIGTRVSTPDGKGVIADIEPHPHNPTSIRNGSYSVKLDSGEHYSYRPHEIRTLKPKKAKKK